MKERYKISDYSVVSASWFQWCSNITKNIGLGTKRSQENIGCCSLGHSSSPPTPSWWTPPPGHTTGCTPNRMLEMVVPSYSPARGSGRRTGRWRGWHLTTIRGERPCNKFWLFVWLMCYGLLGSYHAKMNEQGLGVRGWKLGHALVCCAAYDSFISHWNPPWEPVVT